MGKGIIRIVNTHNNTEILIFTSDDIDKTVNAFNNGVMPNRSLERYPYKERLKIEVLEKTDNLATRYAFYAWPKLERVSYTEECMEQSLNKGFSTRIKNAVNWFVLTYTNKKYSFRLGTKEGVITGIVYENGIGSEIYTFKKKSGEPDTRGFIEFGGLSNDNS